jgi:hypothetical protein
VAAKQEAQLAAVAGSARQEAVLALTRQVTDLKNRLSQATDATELEVTQLRAALDTAMSRVRSIGPRPCCALVKLLPA